LSSFVVSFSIEDRFGGGQEGGVRSGTLPTVLIAGFEVDCPTARKVGTFSKELRSRVETELTG
jgi:cysteine sulfinate desulfinase/cysteine desulfurase-like protein